MAVGRRVTTFGFPSTVNPTVDSPKVEKPTLIKTDEKKNLLQEERRLKTRLRRQIRRQGNERSILRLIQ